MIPRVRSSLAVAAGILALVSTPVAHAASAKAKAVAPGAARPRVTKAPSAAPPQAAPEPSKPARRASRGVKRGEHTGPIATMPGFTMRPDGTSVIFVDLTAPPQVEEHAGKGFATYVLKNTQVDRANNKNPLETAFYDTPVLRARLRGIPKEGDAELEIELRADVKPTFKVTTEKAQSRLEIVFPAGKFARTDVEPHGRTHQAAAAHREERSHRKGKKPGAPDTRGGKGDEGRMGPKAP